MLNNLAPFIAAPTFLPNFTPAVGTYFALVLMERSFHDDEGVIEPEEPTGDAFAKQLAKELQLAYDDGMAGSFQILKVADNLTPHVLNVITPATPLSPWQIDFANAYGEADYAWMETLADTHDAGDTIFTAVMTELDKKEDCTDAEEAVKRLDGIIADLIKARDAIRC